MAVTRIYQFSDLPLVLRNQAINMDYSTSASGDVNSFLFSHRKYSQSDKYITDPIEITFEGTLINEGILNINSLEQRLRALVGFPDNLICYLLPNDYPSFLDGCVCENGCGCELIWVSVYAKLKEVSIETEDDYSTRKLTLIFSLLENFAPLNPLYFKFDGILNQSLDILPTPSNSENFKSALNSFPSCEELFSEGGCLGCKFFTNKQYDFFTLNFNTQFWEAASSLGCFNYYSLGNDFFTVPTNGLNEQFQIDKDVWSGLPHSIYAFRSTLEIPDTVTLNIKVKYNNGNALKEEVTSIDFSKLNLLMNDLGYGNFGSSISSDVLYLGNINYFYNSQIYRPSFVTRDGVVLDNIHPLIRFPSFSPAQIYSGENDVYVGAKNSVGTFPNFGGFEMAYFHSFRRL